MGKRKWRKLIHNAFFYSTITIAALTFILSVCALDSSSYIPIITGCVSFAWLAFVAWANDL